MPGSREDTAKYLSERVGHVIQGRVSYVHTGFVLVDLGGVTGFLPMHEMGWIPIAHPGDLVSVDDEIEVQLLRFDPTKDNALVSIRALLPDPWEDIESRLNVGKHIQGKVLSLVDYGACVELEKGLYGLVHISSMPRGTTHPSCLYEEGQDILVKILGVDTTARKLSLALVDS